MFHEYFVGKPYPRDTHKNSRLSWFFTFQSCALYVVTSRVSFLRNPLDLQYKLESLHSLSHTTFTIKIPHKYKGKNDWMKLQSNLARNKSQHKIVINNNFTDYLASISGPISSDISLKGSPHMYPKWRMGEGNTVFHHRRSRRRLLSKFHEPLLSTHSPANN